MSTETEVTYITYKYVCETCQQGPEQGVGIYRTGEKGVGKNPHWRCSLHLPEVNNVSPEVIEVTTVIESSQAVKH